MHFPTNTTRVKSVRFTMQAHHGNNNRNHNNGHDIMLIIRRMRCLHIYSRVHVRIKKKNCFVKFYREKKISFCILYLYIKKTD